MDLGDGLIAGLILGYYFLLRAVLNKSVSFAVELWVETYETEKNLFGEDRPLHFDMYAKSCKFIVTPAIGMEFQPEGIEGAIVDRVIFDDQGFCKTICTMKVSSIDGEFEEITRALASAGWSKQPHYEN